MKELGSRLLAYTITPALDRSHLPGEPAWLLKTAAIGSGGKSGNFMGKLRLKYLNWCLK